MKKISKSKGIECGKAALANPETFTDWPYSLDFIEGLMRIHRPEVESGELVLSGRWLGKPESRICIFGRCEDDLWQVEGWRLAE